MKPLISVIIPSYNSEKTIGIAIESMINQTYPNLEIIIIDDNSTDNTEKIVTNIASKNNNVFYYKLPYSDPNRFDKKLNRNINAGYSARNYGIQKANGEWITFQDADDASLLNRIEVQYELAIKNDAIHVSIDCIPLNKYYLNKKLNVDEYTKDEPLIKIEKDEIYKLSQKNKGIVISLLGKFNSKIPFHFKRKRFINRLFFGALDPYPLSGNCPLFKKEVVEKVKFRELKNRVWPSFMGRGADRDFNFQVAETFRNSLAFKLPLYMWGQLDNSKNNDEIEKYLM